MSVPYRITCSVCAELLQSCPQSETVSFTPRGFGSTSMKKKVNDVLEILQGAPKHVLFDALDSVWRRSHPEEPSLRLMMEVTEQARQYNDTLNLEGPHQQLECHKVARSVVKLATMPEDGSSELPVELHVAFDWCSCCRCTRGVSWDFRI